MGLNSLLCLLFEKSFYFYLFILDTMIELTDLQKIGLGLVGFGSLFLTIGVFLFLDKVLLALGNILFLCGLCLLIGVGRTLNFFWQPHNPIKMKVSDFKGSVLTSKIYRTIKYCKTSRVHFCIKI